MSLLDRLTEDMKTAMKARESGKTKLSVVRMVKSAVKYQEIEKGHQLSDDQVIEVIAKEVKMRRDSIAEYEKANRSETVEALKEELEILLEYLPQQMSRDEILQLVKETILEVGAKSPKEMGKVMGKISPLTKGKADGKLVSELVKQVLAGEL